MPAGLLDAVPVCEGVPDREGVCAPNRHNETHALIADNNYAQLMASLNRLKLLLGVGKEWCT